MKRDNISNETLADEILSAPKTDETASLQKTSTSNQLTAPEQTGVPENIEPSAPDADKVTTLRSRHSKLSNRTRSRLLIMRTSTNLLTA